jgi:hypothetical protein
VCCFWALCCKQDPGAGVNIGVHSVPGILDDTVTDWEKAAFGYRYVCVSAAVLVIVVAGSSVSSASSCFRRIGCISAVTLALLCLMVEY